MSMRRLFQVALAALAALAIGCPGNDKDEHKEHKHDEHMDHPEGGGEHKDHPEGGGEGMSHEEGKEGGLDALSPEDRALAEAQKTCPVSGEALGSMGTPVKMEHGGKTVFLCCKGCTNKFKAEPEKFMAKLGK